MSGKDSKVKQVFALIVCCIALVCSAIAANARDESLAGLWRFDEGMGSMAYDSSGNRNNGQIKGNAAWVKGVSGEALKFNGADVYVEIPHSESLNMRQALTVCAWIKIDQKASIGRILAVVDKTRGSMFNKSWSLYWDDRVIANGMQAIAFAITKGAGNGFSNLQVDTAVEDDGWHFVTGTFDTTAPEYQQRLYIDGNLVARKKNSAVMTGNTIPVFIGIAWLNVPAEDGGAWFNGIIDEVRIYNRALSADEVSAIYKSKGEAK
jgi:hypothetical protein